MAQRQGQQLLATCSAVEPFDAVPFFWSNPDDVSTGYVAHAERRDHIELSGRLAAHDALP